jgi:glycosyltransferase involved in cell wall biosynthesis
MRIQQIMTLSIIIPVYNEKATILKVIQQVESVPLPDWINKEIIVVDDNSTDGTKDIVRGLASHPLVRTFFREKNGGKGAAVKLGLKQATGDIILIQDADLEYSPHHYPELLQPLLNNEADIVYGSRFLGNIRHMKLINRLANQLTNLTTRVLFGTRITDINTCFKVFKRHVLNGMEFSAERFGLDTEITAKVLNRGHKIHEVPIAYSARRNRDGKKMTWGQALELYYILIKCRFNRS